MHRFHHDEESCGGAHGGRGRHGFRPPFGPFGGFGGGHGGGRARRGDVRTAILRLLAEQPMHGYQIIQELSSRSGGAWSPSAGSVYPPLQQLADEGLIIGDESGGKKVFSLTDAGQAAAAELADQPAPWEDAAKSDSTGGDMREAAARLMPAIMQVGKSGSAEQVARAVEILTETRKQLYAILAED